MKKIIFILLFIYVTGVAVPAMAATEYSFGVTSRDSVMTTAAQWNPILAWIEKRTGVRLNLKMGLTTSDTQTHLLRGEYDFFVGYPLLQPEAQKELSFHVLAKAIGEQDGSLILVQVTSPYRQLSDLNGQEVSMGGEGIFVGHVFPLMALREKGIRVIPKVVVSQEALIKLFKIGQTSAAVVNLNVLEKAMRHNDGNYRVLWRSELIPPLPIGVQNSVPLGVAEQVQTALLAMAKDPEGQKILADINRRMGYRLLGWEAASDAEYMFAVRSYEQYRQQENAGALPVSAMP
jgi:phosphonate transport system substrate-binding protein